MERSGKCKLSWYFLASIANITILSRGSNQVRHINDFASPQYQSPEVIQYRKFGAAPRFRSFAAALVRGGAIIATRAMLETGSVTCGYVLLGRFE